MKPFARPADPAWLALACAALGLSALAACTLVVAHLPVSALAGRTALFAYALVLHVDLAMLVWLQGNACALWSPLDRKGPTLAFGLALAGALGLVVCTIAGNGSPVLADYLPYLDGGAFLAWVALFLTGTLLCASGSLRRPAGVSETGLLLSRLPWLMVLVDLSLRATLGGPGEQTLREVVWAAGHLALMSAVALLMGLWWRWGQGRRPQGPLPARVATGLFAASVLPSLIPPGLLLAGWRGDELHGAYTLLMSALTWPAALALGLWAALGRRHARTVRGEPISWGLYLSLGLFVLGCALGLLITRQTTLIPAHYHGTLGALTLAFMAMQWDQFKIVPVPRPLALYASGLVFMLLGLAGSGLAGAPRKEGYGITAMIDPLFPLLTGLGGSLAIAATLWFTCLVLPEALRSCLIQRRQPASRDGTFASKQAS